MHVFRGYFIQTYLRESGCFFSQQHITQSCPCFCQMHFLSDFFQTQPSDKLPNWSLQPDLPFNLSADIQSSRQNHPRPISTKLWWSILLFQGTFQIKGQFWHCSSQIFSKKSDTSRKCVPRFETNKWIIGIVKIVLVFSYQFKTTIISDVWLEE